MPLIDPAVMQLIQFLVYAIGGLLAALATYYAAKAKAIGDNNTTKLQHVEKQAEKAAVVAEIAAQASKSNSEALADNTTKTEQIRQIVNGQTDAREAEIRRLRDLVQSLGGKP